MALIFIKIFIIICLSWSLISDFSANATCTNTDNCGSDSGAGGGAVFPDITSGDFNTAYGFHAVGMDITEGNANTVVGYESGKLIHTGDYNTAVGSDSLVTLTSGDKNTAIGYKSGSTNVDDLEIYLLDMKQDLHLEVCLINYSLPIALMILH